jgi:hypothetical protein
MRVEMMTRGSQGPHRLGFMKTTAYFRHMRQRPDRSRILDTWIELAIRQPIVERVQADGRIRRWVYIEAEARYLESSCSPIERLFTTPSLTVGLSHEG